MAIALLILAVPVVASAQIYQRNYDRYDYNQTDRRDVRNAINRLDYSAARLERDLNIGRTRRVFGGIFYVRNVDESAIAEVQNFRDSVRDLRRSFRGDSLYDSADEARMVLDRGVQLDRYLRLRTGNANVDSDLADLRSALNLLADAFDLRVRY